MDPSVAKALGKLSSGLYVVTAAHSDVRSAMVASWVAQASFEPLGLTIAVAKDRAIESLMQARPPSPPCIRAVERAAVRAGAPRAALTLPQPAQCGRDHGWSLCMLRGTP